MADWIKKPLVLAGLLVCQYVLVGFSEQNAKIIGEHRYYNQTVGISVTKPQIWNFLGVGDQFETKGMDMNLTQEEIEKIKENMLKLEKQTGMEPLSINRFQEPYDGSNPSFQVAFHLNEDYLTDTAEILIKEYLFFFSHKMKNFKIITKPRKAKVSSFEGAYSSFSFDYLLEPEVVVPSKSKFWVVPKGKGYFLLSNECPKKDCVFYEKQFQQIFNSIVIDN